MGNNIESKLFSVVVIFLVSLTILSGQQKETIMLSNPSFEGIPKAGGTPGFGTIGWSDCGSIYFPRATPHDIHKSMEEDDQSERFFNVRKKASDGRTFLGLVVRDSDTYEGVSQRLLRKFEGGKCYTFSVDLSRSMDYLSPYNFLSDNLDSKEYTTPAVLRIWGGSTPCDKGELLAESEAVVNEGWATYSFTLSPKFDRQYFTITAYYKVPTLFPYNGNVLVDNMSNMVVTECPPEEELANAEPDIKPVEESKKVDEIADSVETPATPSTPQTPAKPEKESNPIPEETIVQTEVITKVIPEKQPTEQAEEKKVAPIITINEELDRNSLAKGTTIKIKNLYFAADASDIDPKSTPALDELADFLLYNDDILIELGGHTNHQPTHAYCDSLSEVRAKSVAQFLIDKGVPASQVEYKGYGKRQLISKATTKEARSRNQRVEIKVLRIGK